MKSKNKIYLYLISLADQYHLPYTNETEDSWEAEEQKSKQKKQHHSKNCSLQCLVLALLPPLAQGNLEPRIAGDLESKPRKYAFPVFILLSRH